MGQLDLLEPLLRVKYIYLKIIYIQKSAKKKLFRNNYTKNVTEI